MSWSVKKRVVPAIAIAVLLLVWEAVCRLGVVPAYLLPSPTQIVAALVKSAPLIAQHTATTMFESVVGLAVGCALGFALAVLMDRFELMYMALQPIITVSQTIPTIAIAPLLVLWFGYGLLPKIILIVIVTFFPIAVSLVSGFKSVDPDQIDLMRTMHASEWHIFRYVKLPAAAEPFFSGLRISATYAIVGAVIAEWLGGFSGLGVYMTRVRKSFAYPEMFASILVVSALSLVLLWLVGVLERVCLPWKRAERKGK